MSVHYLLVFIVCQVAYIQSDGITFPITSLSYKSLPTNPNEISLSFPNKENIETLSNAKPIEPISCPIVSTKSVASGGGDQCPIGPIPISPTTKIITNSARQVCKPISIQTLNINTEATTPQVTTLPIINLPKKEENNGLWSEISNNCAPKILVPVGESQNLKNYRNNDIVNLKYSLSANTVPYNAYKVSTVNPSTIYINDNKPRFRPDISVFDTKKLEGTVSIPKRDSEIIIQNQAKSVPNKTNEGMSVISLQQQNMNLPKTSKAPVEKLKLLSNEIPTAGSKGIHQVNNVMCNDGSSFAALPALPSINTLNVPPISGKISIKPQLASTDSRVDLTVTPSVKIGNDKINSSPYQMTISEFENINDIQAQIPKVTTSYAIPKELPTIYQLPKVYQLPNVYTNAKITPVYSASYISPSSSVCKESDMYTRTTCENKADRATVPIQISSCEPKSIISKNSAYPEPIKCVPSIYNTSPAHITDKPTLTQLPNVYTNSKVIYPNMPQRASNIIYINMANMSSPKPIDNIVPIYNSNTEAKIQRPISSTGSATTPIYKPLDTTKIKAFNFLPVPNVHYQSKVTSPTVSSPIESQYSYPSIFPASSDFCSSSVTDSLNNIISSITTGLLSAFKDITTQEENLESALSDSKITTDLASNNPSSIHSETSNSFSMPTFLLNPPELVSPTFLPSPKVDLALKKTKSQNLSKKKSTGIKKPKPYISKITINLVPTKEEINDIIIVL